MAMLFKSKEAKSEVEQFCYEHSHEGGGCGLCNIYLFQLLQGLWARSCFSTLLSGVFCLFVFFNMDHFLKSSLNLLQYYFCFMVWFLGQGGIWQLRLPNQGSNSQPPGMGRKYLNHWTMREVPLSPTLDSGDQWTHDLFKTN